jgi:lipoate-protein ligase B
MICIVHQLGLIEYSKAYELQRRLYRERLGGTISDILLLLEYPPTLTIGRSGSMENVLVPKEKLADEGITFFSSTGAGMSPFMGQGSWWATPLWIYLREKGISSATYAISRRS